LIVHTADYIPAAHVSQEDEDLKDPFCDPDHPVVVTFQDVSAAAYKIQRGIAKTPCNVRTSTWQRTVCAC